MELQNTQQAAERNTKRLFLAILLPPLSVYLETRSFANCAINFFLTLCGYVPGMLHAVFVFLKPHPDR